MTESIAELRRRCQRKTSNLYDTYFVRRVSIYLTVPLWRVGVTPNAVSFANLLVGLAGCFLIGTATGPGLLVGVLCMHLYSILDSVDGELARLTRKFSLQGLFLEDFSAYMLINGFWLALGAHLWRVSGSIAYPALAIAICAFGRNVMPAARRCLIKSVTTRRPLDATPSGRRASAAGPSFVGRLRSFVEESVLHATNVWLACTTALLLEAYAGVRPGLLLGPLFFGYAALTVAREAAGFAVMALGRGLNRKLDEIYENARNIPTGEANAFALSGDEATSKGPHPRASDE